MSPPTFAIEPERYILGDFKVSLLSEEPPPPPPVERNEGGVIIAHSEAEARQNYQQGLLGARIVQEIRQKITAEDLLKAHRELYEIIKELPYYNSPTRMLGPSEFEYIKVAWFALNAFLTDGALTVET